ncbi:MAG: metallophosphoesterase family protein [Dehalogenimonas sp.]|uniref:Metallophosphoesterase family protein n=1 Tax=Candidatus Dehalogenimonas loeffleri TaxID=3127115 RepID=A0ABZ2J6G6_9CHLR|nr:metallophosphoesterase family protein [Dehalogenimonas sp.]
MRYAVLADIHSNLEALSAVLADTERRGGVDEFWVLGDIIGYGPDPHSCIALVRDLPGLVVAGNHDLAAVEAGRLSFNFHPEAAAAVNWTAEQIDAEEIAYLSALPTLLECRDFTLAHGSPRQPVSEYLTTEAAARQNFRVLLTRHGAVGHSHLPLVFALSDDDRVEYTPLAPDVPLNIGNGRFFFNPGSVGQPRDGDPRAAYIIYDTDKNLITLRRLDYDVAAVQRKMVSYNLPYRLISRLERGQ